MGLPGGASIIYNTEIIIQRCILYYVRLYLVEDFFFFFLLNKIDLCVNRNIKMKYAISIRTRTV